VWLSEVHDALRRRPTQPDRKEAALSAKDHGVDHVILCVRPENVKKAAATFTQLLDLNLEGPYDLPDYGLIMYIDWDAGIEIMAPTNPEIAASQQRFLDERGEGIFRVVFRVPNRDTALDRAEAMGVNVASRYDVLGTFPQWEVRFKKALESHLEPVHGVQFNFAEMELQEPH
jgi:4-hydroxyphenylpyruvate dioxygenase-like putative hemolysin